MLMYSGELAAHQRPPLLNRIQYYGATGKGFKPMEKSKCRESPPESKYCQSPDPDDEGRFRYWKPDEAFRSGQPNQASGSEPESKVPLADTTRTRHRSDVRGVVPRIGRYNVHVYG